MSGFKMNMKAIGAGAIACLAVALSAASPAAAKVYDFSFVDADGDKGAGQFETAGSALPEALEAVSGSITIAGQAASTIQGLSSYAGSDQILYPAPSVDFSGISFSAANGNAYNLFNFNGSDFLLSSNIDPVGFPQNGVVLTSLSVGVPEPATWAIMLMGFGALGVAIRARRPGAAVA